MRKVRNLVIGIAIGGTLFSFGCGESSLEDNDANNVTNSTREIKLANEQENCFQDYHLDQGATLTVPANCIAKGDISLVMNGAKKPIYDNEANTGSMLVCLQECTLYGDYAANVTPRDALDVYNELKTSGCGQTSGCHDVLVYVFDGTNLTKVDINSLNPGKSDDKAPTPAPTKAAAKPTTTRAALPTPTTVPTPEQIMNDQCEPEIQQGQKRLVKKGCIVVGDVAARPAGSSEEFKPKHDSRQKTGTVMVLDQDYEVWNTQGASVMPEGMDLASIVAATKLGGCGTGFGCTDGIYDWTGKRLD